MINFDALKNPGFYNLDCMEALRAFPDNYFELAIVDPPYGDGQGGDGSGRFGGMFAASIDGGPTRPHYNRFGGSFDRYKRQNHIIAWDVAPSAEYFEQLFRVSQNQVIWGGNYFFLPPTRCFVVYRKTNIPLKGFSMAPVEYAWTSFNRNAVCIEAFSQGTSAEPRFHPTQKPIALYEELLERFANPGDKILDTHVGSGSSLIACYNMGFTVWGFEIDATYYQKASERLADHTAQIRMDL